MNTYASKIETPQNIEQMQTTLKGEIESNAIIVGEFNTSLMPMEKSTRQKINKKMQALNNTLYHLGLIDIYRAFHQKD